MAPDDLSGRWVSDSPIACMLTEPELAARADSIAADVFAAAETVVELADGYAARFPDDGAWLARLTAVVGAERRCCPFLTFALAWEPDGGPLWLSLRGPEGTKAFVQAAFLAPRRVGVA